MTHRTRLRLTAFASGALALAGVLGFSSRASAGDCVPGSQVACACPGGSAGVQVCSSDGTQLGPCQCAAPPGGVTWAPAPSSASTLQSNPTMSSGMSPSTMPTSPQAQAPAPTEVPFEPLGRTSFNVYVGGAFAFGTNSDPDFKIYGGGVDVGASLLIGFDSEFPDKEGGAWHGIDLRVLGGFYGAGIVYGSHDNISTKGAGEIMGMGSLVLGYEFLHFSEYDAGTKEQGGIGVFVGARGGFQYTEIITNTSRGGVDPTIGAMASLVVPKYKATSQRLSRGMLNLGFWTLPGTGINFYTIGGGAAF
jgi:hypothetical protein